jgi:hypothetical protein
MVQIELTSNRNVYNCVSPAVQQQQPSFPAGYPSSNIFNNKKNSSSTSTTAVNNSESDGSQDQGLSQQQQQQEFPFRSNSPEAASEGLEATVNKSTNKASGSGQKPSPFEASNSPQSQSSGSSSGHSREAFLQNDYNNDNNRRDKETSQGLNAPTVGNTHYHDNASQDQRPSNEALLGTAFISFMSFSLIQLCFAFIAGSQAMKGDSAAMIVDSMTYLSNWIAEKRKRTFDETYVAPSLLMLSSSPADCHHDPVREAQRLKERARRKMILTLEIVPPLISVSALIGITMVVLKQAIHVLRIDRYRQQQDQSDPNLHVMLAFSTCNLGLDALNVFCFAKSKHLMGFPTLPSTGDPHYATNTTTSTTGSPTLCMGDLNSNGYHGVGREYEDKPTRTITRTSGSYLEIDQTCSHDDRDEDDDHNNMSTPTKDDRYHSQQKKTLEYVDPSPKSGDDAGRLSAASRDDFHDDESCHGDGEETNLNMVRSPNRFVRVHSWLFSSHPTGSAVLLVVLHVVRVIFLDFQVFGLHAPHGRYMSKYSSDCCCHFSFHCRQRDTGRS